MFQTSAIVVLAGFGAAGFVGLLIQGQMANFSSPIALFPLWILTISAFLFPPPLHSFLRASGFVCGIAFVATVVPQYVGTSFSGQLLLAALSVVLLAAYDLSQPPKKYSLIILPMLLLLGLAISWPGSSWVALALVVVGTVLVVLGRLGVRDDAPSSFVLAAGAWLLCLITLFVLLIS